MAVLHLRRNGWKAGTKLEELNEESGLTTFLLKGAIILQPLGHMTSSLPALLEISRISAAVAELELLFISLRLERADIELAPGLKAIVVDDSPRPLELYRIRRALWHYILYWAVYGCIDDDICGDVLLSQDCLGSATINIFWSHLSLREAEELECVYIFLKEQQNKSQNQTARSSDRTISAVRRILQFKDIIEIYDGWTDPTWTTKHDFLQAYHYIRITILIGRMEGLNQTDGTIADHPKAAWQYSYISQSPTKRDAIFSRYSIRILLTLWGDCVWMGIVFLGGTMKIISTH